MKISDIITEFEQTGSFSFDTIILLHDESESRKILLAFLKSNPNRPFAVCLLQTLIELRIEAVEEILIEDLMYASYLVGIHGQVEDAVLIWKAKQADFDTYCGMDGELIAFAGKERTIAFLSQSSCHDAAKMTEYLNGFDDAALDEYFSTAETQWWL